MLGFIIGPIFQLQLFGTICPCLESSENKNSRQAVQSINSHCQRILWHPSTQQKNNKGGGFSLMGNWFGGGGGNKDDDDGAFSSSDDQQQPSTSTSSSSEPCLARLTVRDNADSHQLLPEISVDLLLQRKATSPAGGNSSNRKIRIKLSRVDKVRLEDNQIVLTGKPGGSGGGSGAKELLRFTALQQHSNNNNEDDGNNNPIDDSRVEINPITSDARNMLVHHWMVLVEWERQRRDKNNNGDEYDDDDDDDDEHGQPNFIQKRAQQAAHFARREIEMKKMKKEREQRKAKLIAETGGLKYTALAMAAAKNNNNNSIT